MFKDGFGRFVCEGDRITCEVDGFLQHEYVDQFVSRLFADASGTFWKDRPLRAAPALAEVGR